jgi:hypothetical protein
MFHPGHVLKNKTLRVRQGLCAHLHYGKSERISVVPCRVFLLDKCWRSSRSGNRSLVQLCRACAPDSHHLLSFSALFNGPIFHFWYLFLEKQRVFKEKLVDSVNPVNPVDLRISFLGH